MSALVVLAFVAGWLFLGYLIWRTAISRFFGSVASRRLVGAALATAWLMSPWIDEWLGAREFERLCKKVPDAKFFGPVALGSGRFFDDRGQRKLWTQGEIENGKSPFPRGDIKVAYAQGQEFEAAWRQEFERKTATNRIRDWPTPVLEEVNTYVHVPSGKLVREVHWLGSPGGWVKRMFGWGSHAPYSCSKERDSVPLEAWITY